MHLKSPGVTHPLQAVKARSLYSWTTIDPRFTSPINHSNLLATTPPVAPNNSLVYAKHATYTPGANNLGNRLTPAVSIYVNEFI